MVSRGWSLGQLRRQAEASLAIPGHLQRWVVGRALCSDDAVALASLAGPTFDAPFYLCLVESSGKHACYYRMFVRSSGEIVNTYRERYTFRRNKARRYFSGCQQRHKEAFGGAWRRRILRIGAAGAPSSRAEHGGVRVQRVPGGLRGGGGCGAARVCARVLPALPGRGRAALRGAARGVPGRGLRGRAAGARGARAGAPRRVRALAGARAGGGRERQPARLPLPHQRLRRLGAVRARRATVSLPRVPR